MKILLVTAHPRTQSLTHAAAHAFAEAASGAGHVIEWADLMAEGFDPILREADEPDWSNPAKVYSPAVEAEMARIRRNEATVLVFPVWWWSMPALLKGWIDRVWNNGFAYGEKTYPHSHALMIAIAGAGEDGYKKRGYDGAMRITLETGILDYSEIAGGRLELLYGGMDGGAAAKRIIVRARELGAAF